MAWGVASVAVSILASLRRMAAACLSRRSACPAALAGSWVVSMAARSVPNTRSVKNRASAVIIVSSRTATVRWPGWAA